jgi:hypothetical protein
MDFPQLLMKRADDSLPFLFIVRQRARAAACQSHDEDDKKLIKHGDTPMMQLYTNELKSWFLTSSIATEFEIRLHRSTYSS